MEFHIRSESPEEIVLEANAAYRVIGIIFSVLAVIALPIGILAIVAAPRDSMGHAITGFGLFFWGAARAAKRARIVQPAELVFDNRAGVLSFRQRVGRKIPEQARVSYSEIAGFITVPRRDDRMIRHCTALEWRDGSLLILHSHAAEKNARDETLRLQTGVRLGKVVAASALELPVAVREQSAAGVTTFTYQFGFLSRQNLTALLAVAGFIYAMLAIVWGSDVVGMLVVTIFAAVVGGIVGYFALRWVGAEGSIEIGNDEIRYFEKRGFRKRQKHSLPLRELDRVLCTAIGPGGDSAIYLLRKNEYAELRKIDLGEIDLGSIATALSFMLNVFKVYTPTLNFSERLCLAWSIRRAITDKQPVAS